jgi:hypothetical protein
MHESRACFVAPPQRGLRTDEVVRSRNASPLQRGFQAAFSLTTETNLAPPPRQNNTFPLHRLCRAIAPKKLQIMLVGFGLSIDTATAKSDR